MGIYIKGLKMPKDCRECPFEGYQYHVDIGQTYCMACLKVLATAFKPTSFDGRSKWCPLVEVSEPHGRLIDADYLREHLYICETNGRPLHIMELDERLACIDEVPTVIEAEGE